MSVFSNFLQAAQDRLKKKKPGAPEQRIFDPAVRGQMKAARTGRIAGGKAGYQGFGAPPGAEDVAYSQGGGIPSRFRRMAKAGKTSVPRP